MSFLQLLLSFTAPPGPYYPSDSKATCSHQQLRDSYLWNKLDTVPINNKAPTILPVPFIYVFWSFLCSKLVYYLSWECFFNCVLLQRHFLRCEPNCTQTNLRTQRDKHRHIQEVLVSSVPCGTFTATWGIVRFWIHTVALELIHDHRLYGGFRHNNLSLLHVEQPLSWFGSNSLPTGICLYSYK